MDKNKEYLEPFYAARTEANIRQLERYFEELRAGCNALKLEISALRIESAEAKSLRLKIIEQIKQTLPEEIKELQQKKDDLQRESEELVKLYALGSRRARELRDHIDKLTVRRKKAESALDANPSHLKGFTVGQCRLLLLALAQLRSHGVRPLKLKIKALVDKLKAAGGESADDGFDQLLETEDKT